LSNQSPPPPAAGTLSPDGNYRWDGTAWQPIGAAPVAAVAQKKGHMGRNLGLGCLGLIVLIVIIVIATSLNKGGSSGEKVTSTPSAAAKVQSFNVGDTIKVGDNLLFKVDSVDSSAGDQFQTPTKGQYLIVHVTMTNNGKSSVNVSSAISFELRDDTGESFTETILTTAPKPPDGTIAAGDKLAGGLTYDVPKGKTFKLYYKNDVFSGGQVIVNLGAH
jgi:hypothetical protein